MEQLGRSPQPNQNPGLRRAVPGRVAILFGDRIVLRPGRGLSAEVVGIEAWGVVARVTSVVAKGIRLRPEKAGIFPTPN
jgi:hypothetical protein